jgi:thioredoxin-like negative regulator of GroEL
LVLDPSHVKASFRKAQALQGLQRVPEAIATLRALLSRDRENQVRESRCSRLSHGQRLPHAA